MYASVFTIFYFFRTTFFTLYRNIVYELDGPLHGGANEAALRMLQRIGTPENVPAFIEKVKNKVCAHLYLRFIDWRITMLIFVTMMH
jgi:hypothetical protein